MVYPFKGPFSYDSDTVSDWDSKTIGVYYCGFKDTDGKLTIYYIGRAIGDGGVKARLLQHLNENKWRDVTHFGYHFCDTDKEAIDHEAAEIKLYKPKYNTQGV